MSLPAGFESKCGTCLIFGAIEGLADGLVLVDTQRRVLHLNRRAEQILGVSGERVRGGQLPPHLHDAGLLAFWTSALLETEPVTTDLAFPEGRTIRASASVCVSESGDPIGRALLLRDVTREKTIQIELSESLARRLVDLGGGEEPGPAVAHLTARERQILELVASGLSNAAIAARLHVSVNTVASHLKHLYTKLRISSRSQATAYALSHGIRPGAK